MHTIVCIKQIIDPEIPADQFKLGPATKRQVRGGPAHILAKAVSWSPRRQWT
jgi:hypothetical protein